MLITEMTDIDTLLSNMENNFEVLKAFYKNMVNISQYRTMRSFVTGSSREIPGNEIYLQSEMNSSKMTEVLDDDYMFYSTLVQAFPLNKLVPETYSGPIFRIITHEDAPHPGYVWLINESDH